jgi:hypothetical protein
VRLARAIHDHQSAASAPWESERVVDIIAGFLEKWAREGLMDEVLTEWIERFRADKWQAARDYWQTMYAGMAAALRDGVREPEHKPH